MKNNIQEIRKSPSKNSNLKGHKILNVATEGVYILGLLSVVKKRRQKEKKKLLCVEAAAIFHWQEAL
jgi:hypothetical protein